MSRGLGKIERKILSGIKKYEEYHKEKYGKAETVETELWTLSHYIEGNSEEIFLDNEKHLATFSHSTYIKTYNAVKSLERKGYLETKVTTKSGLNYYNNVTRGLSMRLKH